jgi:hypothetical protein
VLAETEIGPKIGKYIAQNRPDCAKLALKVPFPSSLNAAQTAESVHLPFQNENFFCKKTRFFISHPFTFFSGLKQKLTIQSIAETKTDRAWPLAQIRLRVVQKPDLIDNQIFKNKKRQNEGAINP